MRVPTDARQSKLRELAAFEPSGRFEDELYRLTCIAGDLLQAQRVSLMLLDVGERNGTRLKLAALYGALPEQAWKEEPMRGEGIAGQVLAQGCSVRVGRIDQSEWNDYARHSDKSGSFLSCPIYQAGQAVGVLNFSEPLGRDRFTPKDQELAELAALLIGRAMQVTRLSRLLDSRFAQMAFALEGHTDAGSVIQISAHEPEKMARMLAKAFYKEMRHCGFTPAQIVQAAGEIISELTGSLNRHKKRIEREG
jgi:L-methionine (R)-S-oxide reductase